VVILEPVAWIKGLAKWDEANKGAASEIEDRHSKLLEHRGCKNPDRGNPDRAKGDFEKSFLWEEDFPIGK
jgi:hypothetical protein